MQKLSIIAASLAALVAVGCTEATPDITSPDPQLAFAKGGTALNVNGPVWVLGSFSFGIEVVGGTTYEPGQNAHPTGQGTCRDENGNVSGNTADNTVWYNKKGQATGSNFCDGTFVGGGVGGATTTVTWNCEIDDDGLPATYAFANGGTGAPTASNQMSNNENINFSSNLIAQEATQFVHYQTNKRGLGATTGKDLTAAYAKCSDSDEIITDVPIEVWIDLSGFNATGNLFENYTGGRKLPGTGITIEIKDEEGDPVTVDVGPSLTDLHWLFRSRNIPVV